MSQTVATNANEAIALAAQLIAASDRNLKLAAEHLAFAEAEGKTQRQIAEGVGKSPAWVNRLLRWRRDGYAEDTPFGAQSQERSERRDGRFREQARLGPEQEQEDEPEDEDDGYEPKQERSSSARSRARCSESDRTTLVRVLGMLGSNNDHEVLVAARKAEAIRIRLGLTWDDLITAAYAWQRRAA